MTLLSLYTYLGRTLSPLLVVVLLQASAKANIVCFGPKIAKSRVAISMDVRLAEDGRSDAVDVDGLEAFATLGGVTWAIDGRTRGPECM